MTNEGKKRIALYYGILTEWNYPDGYIRKQMKKYISKDEYKYFLKRIFKKHLTK